jgi:hypothetical protein
VQDPTRNFTKAKKYLVDSFEFSFKIEVFGEIHLLSKCVSVTT